MGGGEEGDVLLFCYNSMAHLIIVYENKFSIELFPGFKLCFCDIFYLFIISCYAVHCSHLKLFCWTNIIHVSFLCKKILKFFLFFWLLVVWVFFFLFCLWRLRTRHKLSASLKCKEFNSFYLKVHYKFTDVNKSSNLRN